MIKKILNKLKKKEVIEEKVEPIYPKEKGGVRILLADPKEKLQYRKNKFGW